MTWRKKAIQMYRALPADEKPRWKLWARRFSNEYGENVTPEAVRSVCRRAGRIDSLRENKKSVVEAPAKSQGDLTKNLLANIEKGASFDGLRKNFGLTRPIIDAHIEDLQESGYDIVID